MNAPQITVGLADINNSPFGEVDAGRELSRCGRTNIRLQQAKDKRYPAEPIVEKASRPGVALVEHLALKTGRCFDGNVNANQLITYSL